MGAGRRSPRPILQFDSITISGHAASSELEAQWPPGWASLVPPLCLSHQGTGVGDAIEGGIEHGACPYHLQGTVGRLAGWKSLCIFKRWVRPFLAVVLFIREDTLSP